MYFCSVRENVSDFCWWIVPAGPFLAFTLFSCCVELCRMFFKFGSKENPFFLIPPTPSTTGQQQQSPSHFQPFVTSLLGAQSTLCPPLCSSSEPSHCYTWKFVCWPLTFHHFLPPSPQWEQPCDPCRQADTGIMLTLNRKCLKEGDVCAGGDDVSTACW